MGLHASRINVCLYCYVCWQITTLPHVSMRQCICFVSRRSVPLSHTDETHGVRVPSTDYLPMQNLRAWTSFILTFYSSACPGNAFRIELHCEFLRKCVKERFHIGLVLAKLWTTVIPLLLWLEWSLV